MKLFYISTFIVIHRKLSCQDQNRKTKAKKRKNKKKELNKQVYTK